MSKKKHLDMRLVSSLIRQNFSLNEIGKIVRCNRKCIWLRMKEIGLSFHEIKFDHDFFSKINTEAKAYWLGYIMADGCVTLTQSNRIDLSSKDEKHLLKWQKQIFSNHNLSVVQLKKRNYYKSSHVSIKMVKDLSNHGVAPRKTFTLKFPNTIPQFLIRHFIRGYFDGDFSLGLDRRNRGSNNTPYLRFEMVGTYNFLAEVKKILGIKSKIRKRGKVFITQTQGNFIVKKIMDWLYKDCSIYLDRKMEDYKRFKHLILDKMMEKNFKKIHKKTREIWLAT